MAPLPVVASDSASSQPLHIPPLTKPWAPVPLQMEELIHYLEMTTSEDPADRK